MATAYPMQGDGGFFKYNALATGWGSPLYPQNHTAALFLPGTLHQSVYYVQVGELDLVSAY